MASGALPGAGSAQPKPFEGGHVTILVLVVLALTPSLVVLAAGSVLAAFRVARERRAISRPAPGTAERPDSPAARA
jgi:hypothetical protein